MGVNGVLALKEERAFAWIGDMCQQEEEMTWQCRCRWTMFCTMREFCLIAFFSSMKKCETN